MNRGSLVAGFRHDFDKGTFTSTLHADCLTKWIRQFRLGIAIKRHFECSGVQCSGGVRRLDEALRVWTLNAEHSNYLRHRKNNQRWFKAETNFKYLWIGLSICPGRRSITANPAERRWGLFFHSILDVGRSMPVRLWRVRRSSFKTTYMV